MGGHDVKGNWYILASTPNRFWYAADEKGKEMSREFRAIIGVGVSVGTLLVTMFGLMSLQMSSQHGSINARLDTMQIELIDIGQRVAYIEGRLDIQLPPEEKP